MRVCVCGGGGVYWFSFLAKGYKDYQLGIHVYVAVVSAKLNINKKLSKG